MAEFDIQGIEVGLFDIEYSIPGVDPLFNKFVEISCQAQLCICERSIVGMNQELLLGAVHSSFLVVNEHSGFIGTEDSHPEVC